MLDLFISSFTFNAFPVNNGPAPVVNKGENKWLVPVLIFIIVAGYTTLKILNDIIMLIKIRKTKKDKAIEELIEKEVERRLQYDNIFNNNN